MRPLTAVSRTRTLAAARLPFAHDMLLCRIARPLAAPCQRIRRASEEKQGGNL